MSAGILSFIIHNHRVGLVTFNTTRSDRVGRNENQIIHEVAVLNAILHILRESINGSKRTMREVAIGIHIDRVRCKSSRDDRSRSILNMNRLDELVGNETTAVKDNIGSEHYASAQHGGGILSLKSHLGVVTHIAVNNVKVCIVSLHIGNGVEVINIGTPASTGIVSHIGDQRIQVFGCHNRSHRVKDNDSLVDSIGGITTSVLHFIEYRVSDGADLTF